jgi:hypothetical protein
LQLRVTFASFGRLFELFVQLRVTFASFGRLFELFVHRVAFAILQLRATFGVAFRVATFRATF